MTLDEFRLEMKSYRQFVDDEATLFKDCRITIERLRALYDSFDERERQLADQVIREWVLSEDEGVRFDAVALIRGVKLQTALPELQLLVADLHRAPPPELLTNCKKSIDSLWNCPKPSKSLWVVVFPTFNECPSSAKEFRLLPTVELDQPRR